MAKIKLEKKPTQERSWREVDQTVNPRTMSASGRRRLVFAGMRWALFGTMAAGILWGATEILQTLTSDAGAMSDPAQAAPLREIVLINDADGVLAQE